MFSDNDLMVAAICDPRFKTNWLSDSGNVRQAEKLIIEVFNRLESEDDMQTTYWDTCK